MVFHTPEDHLLPYISAIMITLQFLGSLNVSPPSWSLYTPVDHYCISDIMITSQPLGSLIVSQTSLSLYICQVNLLYLIHHDHYTSLKITNCISDIMITLHPWGSAIRMKLLFCLDPVSTIMINFDFCTRWRHSGVIFFLFSFWSIYVTKLLTKAKLKLLSLS